MIKMKIRDGHALLDGDDTTYIMESGTLEILADDGRPIWSIRMLEGGKLDFSTGIFCKHEGVVLDNTLKIIPRASNCIILERSVFNG